MEKLSCVKKCFSSRQEAKKKVRELNRSGTLGKELTDVYYCNQCSAWHMTSMKKKKSRHLTRKSRGRK
jgi:hypothetical protein